MKKIFFLFLIACWCDAQPVVEDFLPRSGFQGGTLIIAGTGFSATPSNNKVTFNGIPAVVNGGSSTSLSVTIPPQVSLNYITIKNGSLSGTSLIPFDVINSACSTYTFVNSAYLSTGNIPQPYGVTTGDFNGDGYLDVASSNHIGGGVSVFIGTGTGTFANKVNYSAGNTPLYITSGDFNADGFIDLVTANSGDNTITIIPGLGSGTFGSAIPYAVGSYPKAVCVSDFNADGYQDVATANFSNNTISVLLNTGTGLGPSVIYNVDTQPNFIAIADFNNDGKPDLVTTNYNSSNISVLTGTGTGTFGTAKNITLDVGNPSSLAVGDFNGDDRPDLAITNSTDNSVSVMLASGMVAFGTQVVYDVGVLPNSIIVGDFNGDGKQDLATANLNSGTVTILKGSGTGTFVTETTLPGAGSPSCLAVGDFNGDSKHDLVFANSANNLLSVYLGECALGTVFVQQPESATVCSGMTNAFTASATGTGAITYVWSNGAIGNTMSTSIAGNYMVTASGMGGMAVSTVVGLTVNTIPAVNINYGVGNYCQNYGTVTISGTYPGGGVFSAAPGGLSINSLTGAVVTGFSSTQAYVVTYSKSITGCGIVSTTTGMTVTGVPSSGNISGPTMTCYGNTVGLTLNSASSGITIQWKESLNSGPYNSIGSNLTTVTSSVLTINGSYAVVVSNGICAVVTSTSFGVGVTSKNDGGTITGAITVCSGNSTSLSSSGYNGSVFQWQIFSGSFTDVGGAYISSYTTPLLSTGTYQYRLKVTDIYACAPGYSNVLTVTAAPCTLAANYTVSGAAVQQCISGNSFQFNDISSGTVTGWAWNFGSGASLASASTKGPHTVSYSTPGTKTILLSVSGMTGTTSTFSGIVQVDALGAFGSFLSNFTDPICNTSTVGVGVSTITATSMLWYSSTDNVNYKSTGITIPIFNTVLGISTYFKPSVTNGICPAVTSPGQLFVEIEDCGSIPVTAVTIGGSGGVTTITVSGGTLQIIADIYPASANSNTVPSWSITPSSVATIDGVTGIVTAISDGIVTVTGTFGTVTGITIITITGQTIRQPQSITFNSLPVKTYEDSPLILNATATSGLVVSYSSSDLSIAIISGNVLSIVGAGVTTITASQIGNSGFFPAIPISRVFSVNKAIPILTLGDIAPRTLLSIPFFSLPLTVTSGLSLIATSSDPSVVVFIGLTASVTGPGAAQITVSFSGNNNYLPASDSAFLLVTAKQDQLITITPLPDLTYGISPVTLSDTSTSALPVFVSSSNLSVLDVLGKSVSITGAGTAILTYSQSGNVLFNPAPMVYDTIIVNKSTQFITFPPIPEKIIEDRIFPLIAKASSGLPVKYATSDSSIIALNASFAFILKVGVTTLTASIGESANYLAAENAYVFVTVSPVPKIYFGIDGKNVVPTKTVLPFNAVASTSVAGYTYAWSYLGKGATFMNDSTAETVNIVFAEGTSNGFLVLTVYDKYGNEVRDEGKYITVATSGNMDYTQLKDLICDDHVILCSKLYIENVRINTLISTLTGCVPGGKSDFTSSPFTTTLLLGNTYNLDIECKSDSSVKTRYIGVWIDYNNRGDFDGPDDFISAFYGTGDKLSIKNIPIRNVSAYAGIRKMRIRLRSSKEFTASESCEAGETELGETEDYLLTLKEKDRLQAVQFISPNGDGENDLFIISGIDPKESNKLTVLDKMGQVKFEKENYDNSWPPAAGNNGKVAEGTYFFHFSNGGEELKGYLVVKY